MSYDAEISITTIPLHLLQPSPDNPRKTSAGEVAAAELKASIKAEGLLSSLVVLKDPENDGGQILHNDALDLQIKRTQDRPLGVKSAVGPGEDMLKARESFLKLDWLKKKKGKFEAFNELSAEDKRELFAACVARSIKGQLAVEHKPLAEFEATADRLDIAFHSEVRPTAENFWSHIPKAKALAIAVEVLGESWAKAHKGDKKDVLAAALEKAFAIDPNGSIPAGVDPNVWGKVKAWSIPGFEPKR